MTVFNRLSLASRALHLVLLVVISVGASCGDDDDNKGSFCSTTLSKFRECALLTAGPLPPCDESGVDRTQGQCMQRCTEGATCTQLKEAYCAESTSNAFVLCMRACAPTFLCNDGTTIPEAFRCDGTPDCNGDANEDELGCPAFTCQNGQVIPDVWRCDGEPDCDDESDETGCPAGATFTCTNGTTVPADYRCDSEPDCDDGTDELGCTEYATLICE